LALLLISEIQKTGTYAAVLNYFNGLISFQQKRTAKSGCPTRPIPVTTPRVFQESVVKCRWGKRQCQTKIGSRRVSETRETPLAAHIAAPMVARIFDGHFRRIKLPGCSGAESAVVNQPRATPWVAIAIYCCALKGRGNARRPFRADNIFRATYPGRYPVLISFAPLAREQESLRRKSTRAHFDPWIRRVQCLPPC
jgi:hypothetical protein